MEEKLLEKKLRERVKKLGGIALKFLPFAFTGFPDRMVLMPGGRIWFVEIKTTGKKPKPRQLIVHEMLRRLGFEVWVIDDEPILFQFFKTIEP